jgi:dethiobiotin synthetase
MKETLFVTGIGTGVGKTICSAVFTTLLKADYWKPVQAGDLHQSDSKFIDSVTESNTKVHPERHRFVLAASPHKAASQEQVSVSLQDFRLPQTNGSLIVEGAGGLFVPLNEQECMIDLIIHLNIPVILVTRDYLGCINHTLLSIKALKAYGIPLRYLVFNGPFDLDSERVIRRFVGGETIIINIPHLDKLNQSTISAAAYQLIPHKKVNNDDQK